MSGGHYNYKSLELAYLAGEIDDDCDRLSMNSPPDEWGYVRKAEPPEIIAAMRQCANDLRALGERAKAIEWYLSGDYGPESILKA